MGGLQVMNIGPRRYSDRLETAIERRGRILTEKDRLVSSKLNEERRGTKGR